MEEYDPTIEDTYRLRALINQKEVVLDILDTAGPEGTKIIIFFFI